MDGQSTRWRSLRVNINVFELMALPHAMSRVRIGYSCFLQHGIPVEKNHFDFSWHEVINKGVH